MLNRLVILIICLLATPLASAQQRSFSECLSDWQQQAQSLELSDSTIESVIPSLEHIAAVIRYDRKQPEFTQTFAQYLNRRLTPDRIDRGYELLQEHTEFLAELSSRHGVPGRYLVAFWGLETNFGNYLGDMPTLSSLATLACDQRRSEFFTNELFTALKVMERESLTVKQMQGSWAGAMGHTQFMPSTYQQYAIDGDDDGRINLWRSERDALASGANFLKQLGWQREQRWGREVKLPDNFPYAEARLNNRQSLTYWSDIGITLTNNDPLPIADQLAAVIIPAGHTGPAFLVYPNFNVIMNWNRSTSYALSVGLLADRIAGAGPLSRPPSQTEKALSRQRIKQLQQKLNTLGFDSGKPDGVMGYLTRNAIRSFQSTHDLIADGYPGEKIFSVLALER